MKDRVFTCQRCQADLSGTELERAAWTCPHCGNQGMTTPLKSDADLIHLSSLGLPIQVSGHLCLTWARLTLDAGARAHAAVAAGDTDVEFGESLLTCTAASHAVDAFYGGFRGLVERPTQLTEKSPRHAVVVETAKRAFRLTPASRSNELKWLYNLRNDAVHYGEQFREPVTGPTGRLVPPDAAQWKWASAVRAVTLMLDFVSDCASRPRSDQIAAWSRRVADVVGTMRDDWAAQTVT